LPDEPKQPVKAGRTHPRGRTRDIPRDEVERAATADAERDPRTSQVAMEPRLLTAGTERNEHHVDRRGVSQRCEDASIAVRPRLPFVRTRDGETGEHHAQASSRALGNTAATAQKEDPIAAGRRTPSELDAKVGARDLVTQSLAEQTCRDEETSAVRDRQLAAVQERPESPMPCSCRENLSVGGDDPRQPACGHPAIAPIDGLGHRHIVNPAPQDLHDAESPRVQQRGHGSIGTWCGERGIGRRGRVHRTARGLIGSFGGR